MSFLGKSATGVAIGIAWLSAASFAKPSEAPAPQAMEAVQLRAEPAVAPSPLPAPVLPESPRFEATPSASAVDEEELACMTRVILYEAGAESRAGQVAVAQVVMNRVRSPRFPNSVCRVIYQRGQFSAIRSFAPPRDGRWRRAMAIARDVIAGEAEPVVGNALYFHAARVRPAYVANRARVAQIGNHLFYR